MRFLFAVTCLSLASACGGTTTTDGGAGGAAGAGAGGSNVGGSAGSSSASPCPATAPKSGDACTSMVTCTYGDSPVGDCRQRFFCNGSTFQDQTTGTICPPPGQAGCPATSPTNGASCGGPSDPEITCGYPDATVCTCAACVGGPACLPSNPKSWHCAGAPAAPCPASLPNAGSACSLPSGTMCTYGFACGGGGQATQCTAGAWQWIYLPCPA
jgi:hypothetical protein